jgi:hypothetical protein
MVNFDSRCIEPGVYRFFLNGLYAAEGAAFLQLIYAKVRSSIPIASKRQLRVSYILITTKSFQHSQSLFFL